MGIVNVTPDSFSDGGRYLETSAAVDRALQLVAAGAGILDIGGESTRPGSDGVSADEELRRLVPVVEKIFDTVQKTLPKDVFVPISIDTTKAEVAAECLRIGAEIVNDVSACSDPEMVRVLKETGAGYCFMHCVGTPKTMQENPLYENVVEDVFKFLKNGRQKLIDAGIEPQRIAIDPGLGFGKTTEHNWAIVDHIERFHELDAPILVGHSRKRFVAATFDDRDAGTRIITKKLLERGVHIVRLHEI